MNFIATKTQHQKLAGNTHQAGVVLITSLFILTLLALITIGGTDRALVNIKLTNNLKLREQSFLLAEAALESAHAQITQNPARLKDSNQLIAQYSVATGAYSVTSIYRGTSGPCEDSINSSLQHYELLAVAQTGNYTAQQHALGVALCEYHITDFTAAPEETYVYSKPYRTYWRQVSKDDTASMLEQ